MDNLTSTNQSYGNMNEKNKLDLSNEVRLKKNEEYGLITVSHPNKANSKKLSMKDVLKKMYDEGGF